MLTLKEENNAEDFCQIDMNNIQLLYYQNGRSQSDFPSCFSLIKSLPMLDADYVSLYHMQQSNFPVLQYKLKELVNLAVKLLKTSSFVKNKMSDKFLHKLVGILAKNYKAVAFHNFSHAFTLTMINYQCFVKDNSLKMLYSEEQYFYILIAGLSHDLNHNGTNNSFQIKTGSELAKISANQSVLQNMHLRTLWSILEEESDINFLSISTDKIKAKHIITRLILNTDMALHSSNQKILQNLRKTNQFDPRQNNQHRWILMERIFHGCDIGYSCQDYECYLNWAALLTHEFNQQAKLQQQLNLKVTQCFIYKDLRSLYNDQIYFLGDMVLPMWKQISQICPSLRELAHNISLNQIKIKQQLSKLTE